VSHRQGMYTGTAHNNIKQREYRAVRIQSMLCQNVPGWFDSVTVEFIIRTK